MEIAIVLDYWSWPFYFFLWKNFLWTWSLWVCCLYWSQQKLLHRRKRLPDSEVISWWFYVHFIISGALQQTGVLDLIGARLLFRLPKPDLSIWLFTSCLRLGLLLHSWIIRQWQQFFLFCHCGCKKFENGSVETFNSGCLCVYSLAEHVHWSERLPILRLRLSWKIGMQTDRYVRISSCRVSTFVTGLLYMALVGKRSLPDNKDESMEAEFGLRAYVSEIVISQDSRSLERNFPIQS